MACLAVRKAIFGVIAETMGDLRRRLCSLLPRALLLLMAVGSYVVALYWYLSPRKTRMVSTDPSVCNADQLQAWANRKGIRFKKVAVAEFVYEDPTADAEYWLDTILERRGLLAMEGIRAGEVLVEIPWKACLTTQHIQQSSHPLKDLVSSARGKLDSTEILALFLMYEYHQPNSEWAPYLCLLPRKLTSSLFWDQDTLSAASSELQNRTVMLQGILLDRFKHAVQPFVRAQFAALLPPRMLTISNFLWATSTVRSRQWGLDVGGVHLSVLAPLADMVNHKQGARGGGFPLKDKDGELAFKLVSGANFSRGQEVLVSYGDKCNDMLFLEYGFGVPGNRLPCRWPDPRPLGAASAEQR